MRWRQVLLLSYPQLPGEHGENYLKPFANLPFEVRPPGPTYQEIKQPVEVWHTKIQIHFWITHVSRTSVSNLPCKLTETPKKRAGTTFKEFPLQMDLLFDL